MKIYENLEDYNLTKNMKVLIVFDDIIADMKANKKFGRIVTELLLRDVKVTFHLLLSQNLISKCLKLLFYHENSKQKRTSANSIKSFL